MVTSGSRSGWVTLSRWSALSRTGGGTAPAWGRGGGGRPSDVLGRRSARPQRRSRKRVEARNHRHAARDVEGRYRRPSGSGSITARKDRVLVTAVPRLAGPTRRSLAGMILLVVLLLGLAALLVVGYSMIASGTSRRVANGVLVLVAAGTLVALLLGSVSFSAGL